MPQPKSEFDTPWKQIIDLYFEQFVACCWPDKHHEIDWQHGYKMMDKELNKISRGTPVGNRIVDKLIKIIRKNGDETFVLLHLEIQGNLDTEFSERMFIYRYRLHDLYRKPVVSLAILIDGDLNWRPNSYSSSLWGCSIEMRFPIIKILDFKPRLEELNNSSNLFAPVILAQLAALEKQTAETRLTTKIALTRNLYEKGWQKNDILALYIFIDWILALPETLALRYHEEIERIEEELKVSYITTAERIGIEKGKQEGFADGFQKGEITLLTALLNYKFQTIPVSYLTKIKNADNEALLRWAKRVLNCKSIEEIIED